MVEIDWRHGEKHMWERHGITVADADEAVADVDALWFDPDPKGRSGQGVRIIGYCVRQRAVLTAILVRRDGARGLWGANGWRSNESDRRRYEEGR